MSSDTGRRDRALIAIIAASFNMRIGIVAVGPLLTQIRSDTGMGPVLAGVLGAIPFLCMGVFAHAGVPLIRRLGDRRLVFGSLALIVGGTLTRAAMSAPVLVVLATVPLGIGIALIGLALPSVTKRTFAIRVGAATGVYVASQALGAGTAAFTMIPLSHTLGGWRGAFGVSVLPTLIALPLWLLLPKERRPATADGSGRRTAGSEATRPLRPPSSRGLLLAAVFGLQSMCYAGMINWLATVCVHTGFSPGEAGLATAMVAILGVPAALIVPGLSDGRDRGKWVLGTAVVMGVGIAGLAFTPTNVPWLWIVSFSLGSGAVFPLVLTLPLDLGSTTHDVTELTSWMFGYGYFLSATGPLLVGSLYGLTGGFMAPLALLAVLGTSAGVIALTPALRSRTASIVTGSAGVIV